MMMSILRRVGVPTACAVLLAALGGCVNLGPGTLDEPQLLLLSSMPPPEEGAAAPAETFTAGVGVGPVALSGALNRPQLVTRTDPNRVELLRMSQWAEPLGEGIRRVLVDNLAILLGSHRVHPYPWDSRASVAVQVAVEIVRLDAAPGEHARLEARWALVDQGDRGFLARQVTRITVPLDGDGAVAMVAAESQALEQLSREIATRILVMDQ